ncbi:MAG: type 2 isopentenyl-diphosphate Delta-isomerase [Anaerolineae bacterium]|nr:type 2 isopentenyl-diphosphate Delta-isomerase [Anaerolineae bacterium]
MSKGQTKTRKDDHLRISIEEDVSFDRLTAGFEQYQFVHQALPEMDMEAISTATTFLGKSLDLPLLISSMTGGTDKAARINQILAEAAQASGIGLGLGSIRPALEDPELMQTFQVRRYAPDSLILVNLGAIQLNYGYGLDECRKAVDMVEADGLILHLNALQEALQPEGQTNFADILSKIEIICGTLEVPVIAKEVGWGLSKTVARQLIDAGVTALDIAGAGGTSWSQVEMYRSRNTIQKEISNAFRDWGIPTALSIQMVREVNADIPLIASGGIENGVEIAKALALGANMTATARTLLRVVNESPQAVLDKLVVLQRQLQIAMFAVGAKDITALRQKSLIPISAYMKPKEL